MPGDLRIEIECDYLRDRFESPGDRFFLTLSDCSRFAYIPWSNDTQRIDDFVVLASRRLWVLSADQQDGWCKVHCSEAIPNGNGGALEVAALGCELRLDDDTRVTLEELRDVSRQYWDEWESSARARREQEP